ncbi:ABC transporter permease [Ferrimonas lipolytica]|uniref:ABC transporter permease n=1 Tax=Ferrimonas lipolytica TaxID=2724191 RepID=A0A6H1UBS6_9GAMM|nr:ABC transporter permease [Ferrimonas lipolytica]QIZ75823.1 ABC transporter permease [Ferrimonas lipolytica]
MISYLLRRINLLILTSLVLSGLIYIATLNMPGDPVTNLSGITNPTEPQRAQIVEQYRLDQGMVRGYIAFVSTRLSGDLGQSQVSGATVAAELSKTLPATLELSLIALMLALVVGVPLGILAAGRTGLWPKLLWAMTLLSFSLPAFWLGILLLITFGLDLDLLPPSGRLNLLYDVPYQTGFMLIDIPMSAAPWRWQALNDAMVHLVMPVMVMAALPTTLMIRTVRVSMLAEVEKPYIRALKARGVAKLSLVINHAIPNSVAPMFRTMTLQLGPIASTLVVVETIFNWPGIGSYLMSALYQGDYTALHSGIIVMSVFIIVVSIVLEVAHALLNPVSRKEIHG